MQRSAENNGDADRIPWEMHFFGFFFPLCSASSGHKAAGTGRAGLSVLAQAALPAARTRWKNRDAPPSPAGTGDAGNSAATFGALAARWEEIQALLVSGRRAGTRFMRPEGEKREAKPSQLEPLALGEAGAWLWLKVAHPQERWCPRGWGALVGSVLAALCPWLGSAD